MHTNNVQYVVENAEKSHPKGKGQIPVEDPFDVEVENIKNIVIDNRREHYAKHLLPVFKTQHVVYYQYKQAANKYYRATEHKPTRREYDAAFFNDFDNQEQQKNRVIQIYIKRIDAADSLIEKHGKNAAKPEDI
jgi:hypothetical protein